MSEERPKVSILLATYNRAHLIDRAIESARAQTLKNWEMIVVDDGEDRETKEKMEEWERIDPRIRYFRIPRVGRIATVSNYGLTQAEGEYVAILDDDDAWILDRKLEDQVKYLDAHPEFVGIGGGMVVRDEFGKEKFRIRKPLTHAAITGKALFANPIANPSSIFRKSAAEAVGLYDDSLEAFADWDFWLKMGLIGKLCNFNEYLVNYTMWPGGSSFSKQRANAKSAWRIVWRYRGKYPGFLLALGYAGGYLLYAHLPAGIRNVFNPALSRIKKIIGG